MSDENPSFNFDKFMESIEKTEAQKAVVEPKVEETTQQRQYALRYRERAYNSTRYNQ